jgi:hypothetical protein
MELLDLMIEIERFADRKGLNSYKTTINELIKEMAAELSEEE